MPDQQPLTVADYKWLLDNFQTDDAKKVLATLSPQEKSDFAGYQEGVRINRGNPELHRVDNSLLGMPPELAVVSGLGLARAVAAPGLTAAGRVVAGAKNAVAQATPVLKYEATKHILTSMGVPQGIAIPAAMAVSGYRTGGKPAAAEAGAGSQLKDALEADPRLASMRAVRDAGQTMSPLELSRALKDPVPVEAPPATAPAAAPPETPPAPVPSVGPSAAPSAPAPAATPLTAMPGALTDEEVRAVEGLVAKGYDRDQVLTALANQKAGAIPSTAAAPRSVPKLTAAEVMEVQRMIRSGQAKNLADAIQKMSAAKELAARLGLKTPTVAETKFPKGFGDYGSKNPVKPLR